MIGRLRRNATAMGAVLALLIGLAIALAAPAQAATSATFTKTSPWESGYNGSYTIANTGPGAVTGWRLEFDLPAGTSVGTFWDALMTRSGNHYTFTNRDYNATIPAGGSVSFGFVAAGTGNPTNCRLNGGSCGGGGPAPTTTTSPGPTTTTRPAPTTTAPPPPPPPPGSVRVAPYVDMGSWPTPVLTEMSQASGVRSYTLAFITGAACRASWFGAFDPRTGWSRDQIDAIRAAGGDVKISFGGASGIELAIACTSVAALTAEYQAVISAYNLRYIDLDIEGSATADPASISRRSQALATLQRNNPGLRVSLTLPVLPTGLTADGLNVVRSARDAGVNLDLVNIMAMDYYQGGDMGQKAIQAAQSTVSQLRTLYPSRTDAELRRMVGVTPMIGQNDSFAVGETFFQADARELVQFAQQQHLGMLSFWEMTRDRNACNGPLFRCTNVPQSPFEFSRIFTGFTG
jgi:Cellulose binding domain/Glycosyl hydrolases family 18